MFCDCHHDVAGYLRDHVGSYHSLPFDLRQVNFFGLAGLSVLEGTCQSGLPLSQMAVVPSLAVVRLLGPRITNAPFPVFDDLGAALNTVQNKRPVLTLL